MLPQSIDQMDVGLSAVAAVAAVLASPWSVGEQPWEVTGGMGVCKKAMWEESSGVFLGTRMDDRRTSSTNSTQAGQASGGESGHAAAALYGRRAGWECQLGSR
jgi:hypothetical protein